MSEKSWKDNPELSKEVREAREQRREHRRRSEVFDLSDLGIGPNGPDAAPPPDFDDRAPPPQGVVDDDEEVDIKLWNAGVLSREVLPPREWILGNIFCRQFLSSLLGSGGVGKTALRLVQALEVATGRSLTGEHVHQRCVVLFLSFEDGILELKRRVRAAMLYHSVSDEEVDGWLWYAAITGHKLAEITPRSQKIVPGGLMRWLRATIKEIGAGLVILDPFIKTHGVSENDNSAMDQVCALLADLAVELNFAADAPHHIRKGAATPGDPDIGRGASATQDAGRLVYTATKMDEQTAELFDVANDQRQNFVRMDSAKVNITPSLANAVWFKLVDVAIGNTTPQYPNGDHVQTVERWYPSSFWAGFTNAALNQILDKIDAGPYDGARYSPAPNAKERAAWPVILETYPDLGEKQAKSMIATWIKNGVLVKRCIKIQETAMPIRASLSANVRETDLMFEALPKIRKNHIFRLSSGCGSAEASTPAHSRKICGSSSLAVLVHYYSRKPRVCSVYKSRTPPQFANTPAPPHHTQDNERL
jgi:hypothetical protein